MLARPISTLVLQQLRYNSDPEGPMRKADLAGEQWGGAGPAAAAGRGKPVEEDERGDAMNRTNGARKDGSRSVQTREDRLPARDVQCRVSTSALWKRSAVAIQRGHSPAFRRSF